MITRAKEINLQKIKQEMDGKSTENEWVIRNLIITQRLSKRFKNPISVTALQICHKPQNKSRKNEQKDTLRLIEPKEMTSELYRGNCSFGTNVQGMTAFSPQSLDKSKQNPMFQFSCTFSHIFFLSITTGIYSCASS